MNKRKTTVHCTYAQAGKNLTQILEESFQFYLIHILEIPDNAVLPYYK